MRPLKIVFCLSVLVVQLSLGETNSVEVFQMARMVRSAIFAREATQLDSYDDIKNVRVNCFVCSGRMIILTNDIVNCIREKYIKGVKRSREWGNWYEFNYAYKYWGFFDKKGSPVFMLCLFDKQRFGFSGPLWGIIGLYDMTLDGEKGPGSFMYQLDHNDDWDGTFESKNLEEAIIAHVTTNGVVRAQDE